MAIQVAKPAIVVRVPVEMHRELLRRARDGERSVAAEVRLAVREHLSLVSVSSASAQAVAATKEGHDG